MGCEQVAARAPETLKDSRLRLQLLDETLALRLEAGDVALISLKWLLQQRPGKLLRRQDLEQQFGGSAHVPPRRAAALLRAGKRYVLSVTYGWRTPGDPDPSGEMLSDVLAFLDFFVRQHRISGSELENYGIFWDFGSLFQLPRSDRQEAAFRRALESMANVYASAIGTCVLRYNLVPSRPRAYDGWVALFAVPEEIDEPALRQLLPQKAEIMQVQLLGRGGPLNALVQFETHDSAERAVVTVREWANDESRKGSCPAKGACMQWNDKPVDKRGWPTLELAVTLEVVTRARMPGFENARMLMEGMPIPKLYDITVRDGYQVIQGAETPQLPQQVEKSLQDARFTAAADKDAVVRLYQQYRRNTFDKMNCTGRYHLRWDNTVVDMDDERGRIGQAAVAVARPLHQVDAEVVQRLNRRAEFVSKQLAQAVHVVPVALVQLGDYVSDIFVLARFYQQGNLRDFYIGTAFLGMSVATVWVVTGPLLVFLVYDGEFCNAIVCAVVVMLAPLNLHIMAWPFVGNHIFDVEDDIKLIPPGFWLFKLLETGLESVPLSILTVAAIYGEERGSADGLLWSSLALSSFSMAYGFFGMCSLMQTEAFREEFLIGRVNSTDRVRGKRVGVFFAILIHVWWTLGALGSCWGTPQMGAAQYLLPAALVTTVFLCFVGGAVLVFVVGVVMIAGRLGYDLVRGGFNFNCRNLMPSSFSGCGGLCVKALGAFVILTLLCFLSVALSVEAMAVDLALFAAPFAEDLVMSGSLWKFPWLLAGVCRALPCLRRAQLLAMAAAAVVVTWPAPGRCTVLCCLLVADSAASIWLWRTLCLINWPPWSAHDLSSSGAKQPSGADTLALPDSPAGEAESEGTARVHEAAAAGGYLPLLDMLDGVICTMETPERQAQPTSIGATDVQEVHLSHAVKSACMDVRLSLADLEEDKRRLLHRALSAYLPSTTGRSEAALLRSIAPHAPSSGHLAVALAAIIQSEHGDVGEDRQVDEGAQNTEHPMRRVLLAFALQRQIWAGPQSMLGGRRGLESYYDLSEDAEQVDYFVSHSPADDGDAKVSKLREFLCVQPLVGSSTIVTAVLAVILASLGFAIHEYSPGFPWWTLSALVLALYFSMLGWILISLLDLFPFALTPWSFVSANLWLDSCCVDTSTPESIDAAVRSFPKFVSRSGKMIAIVSSKYFGNLRCVFELAIFCRKNRAGLDSRLLLLSPSWPSTIHPCKRKDMTCEERGWIASFSCRSAKCVKPADRAMLLGEIRKEWGSEAEFERFVRAELPVVFENSKAQYRRRMLTVALRSCELVFGD